MADESQTTIVLPRRNGRVQLQWVAAIAVSLATLIFSQSDAVGVWYWDQPQNTSGYTSPASSLCFFYASAPFDVQCYSPDATLSVHASTFGLAFIAPAQGYCGSGTAGFDVDDYGRVLSATCATYVTPSTTIALSGQIDGVGPVVGPVVTLIDQMGATTGQALEWNGSEWAPATPTLGTVTSVTASPPLFSSGGTTPNLTEQGAIVSGSTSTTAQDLGLISTSILACSTAAGVCTVDGVTVGGGLAFNTGTATETLANTSLCGNLQAVQGSTTGGLTCDPITGPATNGVAYFNAISQLDEDAANFGWNDAGKYMTLGATTAPGTPSIGTGRIYEDSTSKNIAIKNDAGTVNHGIQTATPGAGFAINAIHDDGTVSAAAVQSPLTACTDYVSVPCQGVSSDLANTNANVEVNAVHDGSSVRHPITGAWTTSSMVVTDSSGNITTGSAPTLGTLSYALSLFAILNAGEAVQGGLAPNPSGAISIVRLEYPIGVSASNVTLHCYLATNNITSGTYTVKAARNGVDTGASLAYTSASTANLVAVTSATVTSPSSGDTWGLDITTVGLANNPCGSGVCDNGDLYCTILLQP